MSASWLFSKQAVKRDGGSEFPEIIVPNLKKRFSGITSTIIQVLPHQKDSICVRLLGHPLDVGVKTLSLWQLIRISGGNHPNGYPIIFHARRNNDMVMGLLLKYILRRKLHLIFTSVAQRNHTAFTRFLYFRMDSLLSTSDRSGSYLKREPDRIIPHGTDIERYRPAEDLDSAWAEKDIPGKYGIGIFGRVRPNKGLREFVESLCKVLPDHVEYTAVICGEVVPKHEGFVNELKALIEAAGLKDRFAWLGKRPFDEIPSWFRSMSIVAAVSHTEGFGLTCLEAMASGVPVIATQTGGFEMVIRDGIDGKIIPIKDTDALVDAFRELLSDRHQLETMKTAARERIVESFTVEREVSDLVNFYREIQARYVESGAVAAKTGKDNTS